MIITSNYIKKSVLALSVTTAIALSGDMAASAQGVNFNSEFVNAAEYGNIEKLEALIHMGADVNEAGDFGTTALTRATYHGSKEIVELLITNGANLNSVDAGGATALHIAAREGNSEIVKMLIEAGADVNIEDNEGNTPLIRASAEGHENLAKMLVVAGAEVNKTNDSGESALVYAAEVNSDSVVEELVNSGATKNIIDEEGYSIDEIASRKGNSRLVAKLDKANSDHIELFVTSSAPKIDSKKVLYKLEENNKLDLAEAKTLGPVTSYTAPKKDWLNGLREVFQAAGAFELAAVKKYEAGSKYILLDFGSFKDKSFADRRLAEIKKKQASSFKDLGLTIVAKGSGENKTYSVKAGILNDKTEALDICKGLVAQGINCRPVESALVTAEQFQQFSVPLASTSATASLNDAPKKLFEIIEEPKASIPAVPTLPKITKLDNSVTKAPTERVRAVDLAAPSRRNVVSEVLGKPASPIVETAKLPVVEIKKPAAPIIEKPSVTIAKKIEAPKIEPEIITPKIAAPKIAAPKIEVPQTDENLLDVAGFSSTEEDVKIEVPKVTPVIKKVEAPKIEPKKAVVAKAESKIISAVPVRKPEIKQAQVSSLPALAQRETIKVSQVQPLAAPVTTTEEPVSDDEISSILRDIFAEDDFVPPVDQPVTRSITASPAPVLTPRVQPSPISQLPKLEVAEVNPAPKKLNIVIADPNKKDLVIPQSLQRPEATDIRDIASPATSKFKVAKPIKVNEEPIRDYVASKDTSYTYSVYNKQNSGFDKPGHSWVRISYFQNPNVANAYWNSTKKNADVPNNLRMRAVRSLRSGNSFQAAQIGPFLNDGEALNFCENHAPEGTRCQITQNVRDNYVPIASRTPTRFNGDRGRHSARR